MLCWSSREEIPHDQDKRNPNKMVGVARGHQRTGTLKPYSQKTSQSPHTRTTAFSNSMRPSHTCGATQDGQVMVERSDRMWFTGEGNGKPLQYSCLENPRNSMKRQNNRIPKEELPGSLGAQYATHFYSTVFPTSLSTNTPECLVLPEPLQPKELHHLHTWSSQRQTQGLQSSLKSKPQWMTHMQRWR